MQVPFCSAQLVRVPVRVKEGEKCHCGADVLWLESA